MWTACFAVASVLARVAAVWDDATSGSTAAPHAPCPSICHRQLQRAHTVPGPASIPNRHHLGHLVEPRLAATNCVGTWQVNTLTHLARVLKAKAAMPGVASIAAADLNRAAEEVQQDIVSKSQDVAETPALALTAAKSAQESCASACNEAAERAVRRWQVRPPLRKHPPWEAGHVYDSSD